MGLSSILANTPTQLQSITSIAQSYIVAPLAAFGVAGFVFNAEGEAIANLSADITDHYSEDNTALQDQIAIRPKKITLKGYVGELVWNAANSAPSLANTLTQKLTEVAAFLPALTAGAQTIANGITDPSTLSLSNTSNIYALLQNVLGAFGNTANQQNAYTYFKSLMQSKTLMGIQTPWEFMTNMAIESIVVIQDEKSKFISDFSVTYKEMRFAQTLTTAFSTATTGGAPPPGGTVLNGAAADQAANPVNLGSNPGQSLPVASSPGILSTVTGPASLAPPFANASSNAFTSPSVGQLFKF